MKRFFRYALILILSLLLIASVGIALYFHRQQQETAASLSRVEEQLAARGDELSRMQTALATMQEERDSYLVELETLERRMNGVEEDALLLEGEREELAEQIKLLRVNITEKESAIAALEQDIEHYNEVYFSDVRGQAAIYAEIMNALKKDAPLKRIAKVDKDGNPVAPPDCEILSEDESYYYVYPSLSLYYADLENGYCLNYRGDEVYFSASLIKAPYIHWLLEEISREEEIARANAEAAYAADSETAEEETTVPAEETASPVEDSAASAEETTSPMGDSVASAEETDSPVGDAPAPEEETASWVEETTTEPEVEPDRPEFLFAPGKEIYDLSRTFVYTEDSFREGSGSIQHGEFGDEYSYRELIDLAILRSDNVAFGELRRVFGYSGFYSFNTRLGVNSVRKNFNSITAADMAIYLRAMYTFIEENEAYGPVFGDLLRRSTHTVMIPYAVSPTPVGHKYGWDLNAYHDAAIVYDKHPYVLVVLTDLDHGGTEVDTYIRRVVGLVNKMHRQFYA